MGGRGAGGGCDMELEAAGFVIKCIKKVALLIFCLEVPVASVCPADEHL